MPFVIRQSACRLLLRWCTAELDLGQSHEHGGRRHRPSLRVDEQPIDLGKLTPDPGHRKHKRVTVVVTFPGKAVVESKRDTGAVTVVRVVEQPPLQTNLNKSYF
jgi:hypothetical protein